VLGPTRISTDVDVLVIIHSPALVDTPLRLIVVDTLDNDIVPPSLAAVVWSNFLAGGRKVSRKFPFTTVADILTVISSAI
jgi:hypothetical protein